MPHPLDPLIGWGLIGFRWSRHARRHLSRTRQHRTHAGAGRATGLSSPSAADAPCESPPPSPVPTTPVPLEPRSEPGAARARICVCSPRAQTPATHYQEKESADCKRVRAPLAPAHPPPALLRSAVWGPAPARQLYQPKKRCVPGACPRSRPLFVPSTPTPLATPPDGRGWGSAQAWAYSRAHASAATQTHAQAAERAQTAESFWA